VKILFVTDRVHATADPNINLIKNLLPYLGCECCFMGHDTQPEKADEFCFCYTRDERVRQLYFSLAELPLWKKVLALLCHPVTAFWGGFKLFNIDLIAAKYAKRITRLDEKYHFDAVVSLSAPFYTAKGLAKAQISGKKIIFMFDPYGLHYQMGNRRTRKMEKACFDRVDRVFVPKLIAPHYTSPKVQSYEFPALVFGRGSGYASLYDSQKINLAFVGSLYAGIRSPEYLYELMLRANLPDLHLTIVGGVYGGFSQEFEQRYKPVMERVTMVGKVDKALADAYTAQADVLINIGNQINNMLPSKVLDYIATGKPVINIMQIPNCPTRPYFEKYANALNLCSADRSESDVQKFVEFVQYRRAVPQSTVRKRFYDAEPAFVAKQLLEAIKGN